MPRNVREIERRRRSLNSVFIRVGRLQELPDSAELQSDYARHLCILISGFFEKAIAELILEYANGKAPQQIQSYLASGLRRLTNIDKERLLNVIGSLDAHWRDDIDTFVIDARKAALNSIVGLRNDIAHGGGGSVSLSQVMQYWKEIQDVIDHVEDMLLVSRPRRAR